MEGHGLTSKQSIRSKYLAYRDSLTKGERLEKSKKIWDNLKNETCFEEAEIVLVYMDYRSEVSTTELVKELLMPCSNKRVFAPKVEGMDISFYEIHTLEELVSGYQKIREPVGSDEALFTEETAKMQKCLLLVPGAVFDRELGRMGYGKGFYDRFLQRYDHITRAGFAFECQIAKQIPLEEHDKRMDMIVTERQVIK